MPASSTLGSSLDDFSWDDIRACERNLQHMSMREVLQGMGLARNLECTAELQGYIKRMVSEKGLFGRPMCLRQAILSILQQFGQDWSELSTWRGPPTLWLVVAIEHCIQQIMSGGNLTQFVDRGPSPGNDDGRPGLGNGGGPPSSPPSPPPLPPLPPPPPPPLSGSPFGRMRGRPASTRREGRGDSPIPIPVPGSGGPPFPPPSGAAQANDTRRGSGSDRSQPGPASRRSRSRARDPPAPPAPEPTARNRPGSPAPPPRQSRRRSASAQEAPGEPRDDTAQPRRNPPKTPSSSSQSTSPVSPVSSNAIPRPVSAMSNSRAEERRSTRRSSSASAPTVRPRSAAAAAGSSRGEVPSGQRRDEGPAESSLGPSASRERTSLPRHQSRQRPPSGRSAERPPAAMDNRQYYDWPLWSAATKPSGGSERRPESRTEVQHQRHAEPEPQPRSSFSEAMNEIRAAIAELICRHRSDDRLR